MAVRSGFDVVVIGGGAAGCVVAARLAERTSASVLLLEAGPDRTADAPADLRDGWRLPTGFDWGYVAEADERGTVRALRRGRLLGGTSWLTRFAVRGSAVDFDDWSARGNAGWAFGEVVPYFNRLEADAEFGTDPWHGDRGPLPVTRYPDLEPSDIHSATIQALEAAGFPAVGDHNRPGSVGVGPMPMNTRAGERVTTADAYLPLGGTPAGLTIRCDAQAAAIVMDGRRAVGVALLDGSVIGADRIVLCAGTFGSPMILLRSGIGPADHLRSVDVRPTVDLPGVGANLADHPEVDLDPGWQGTAMESPVLHSIATFHSSTTPSSEAPDLMFWVADPSGDPPSFSMDVVLMKPRSRGSLRLRSADPADPPVVELPGLRDASDVERLAEAYRRGLEVANQPHLRRLCVGPPPADPVGPGALRRFIRQQRYSLPHVVGTCAMGTSPDKGAVVDAIGSVHGTERLSVVDASIIPEAPSGFPHVVTIMIAERLAERIATV